MFEIYFSFVFIIFRNLTITVIYTNFYYTVNNTKRKYTKLKKEKLLINKYYFYQFELFKLKFMDKFFSLLTTIVAEMTAISDTLALSNYVTGRRFTHTT